MNEKKEEDKKVVIGIDGEMAHTAKIIINGKKPRKEGLIIAAYPGMGQSVYTSIYDNYKSLSIHDYETTKESAKQYIEDAINLLTDEKNPCSVVFVDAVSVVLDELSSIGRSFFIFYPATKKESVLELLAKTYYNYPTKANGYYLSEVILYHKVMVKMLQRYPNSMSSVTGIINEEIITKLLAMSEKERLGVMNAIGKMKEHKSEEAKTHRTNKKKSKNKIH